MKLTGKIEAVSSISSGISQMGNLWKSCTMVLACQEQINGNTITHRFLFKCLNESCDKVNDIITMNGDIAGNIEGRYECSVISNIRKFTTRDGKLVENQEMVLTDIVKVEG